MIISTVLSLKFPYFNMNAVKRVFLQFSCRWHISRLLVKPNEGVLEPCRHITPHHLTPNINHCKTTCLQTWRLYVRYMTGVKGMPTHLYQGQRHVKQKEVLLSSIILITADLDTKLLIKYQWYCTQLMAFVVNKKVLIIIAKKYKYISNMFYIFCCCCL